MVTGNTSILKRKKKILITSALPYVNNVPHLGNIIGCVLSADVFSRFTKSYGCDVKYVCGTDEHGTTTEAKAIEEGITPKEICDKYYKIHKEIYEWFNIRFDSFGRTSSKENIRISQDIFQKLDANGYIVEDEIEQMYDPNAKRYLADRFVEGTCPKCGFEDARGDQCDNCGALLDPSDLINPRSKLTGTTPEIRREKHIFIDLPKLSPELKKWIDKTAEKGNWSQNAKTMTLGWLKTGLKNRCISRNLKWGVPIPKKGYEDKVFYSWFDAPIGYIGITATDDPEWKNWWHNPKEVELYQFMGKDNIPFHTIMFPSFLIGAKDDYTLLHQISSTEYLNYEDGQFSKSRGIGVFGNDAIETGIPADIWRYYLLVNRPEQSDTHFSWTDFKEKNNNELLANLGNFVNRTLTFIARNFNDTIPKGKLTSYDKKFISSINEKIDIVTKLLSEISLKEALKQIMLISKSGNQYFQENEPWKTIKDEKTKEKAATTMFICANLSRKLAILIEPYMPTISAKIFDMLHIEPQQWTDLDKDIANHEIRMPEVLFRRFEDMEINAWKEKYAGKQQDRIPAKQTKEPFGMLNLKVAKILSVTNHPDADKLLVLQLDVGTEKRQLVAGLKAYYTPEELTGKHIIIVSNLKPAKLRGKESQGMLLAAEKNHIVKVLEAPNSQPGSQVYIDGIDINEKQITYDDFSKVKMISKKNKIVVEEKILKTDTEDIVCEIDDGALVG